MTTAIVAARVVLGWRAGTCRTGRRTPANIAAILDAATACLIRDPQASTPSIAKAAGVGRVTLYGHFPTRAELLNAVFARMIQTWRSRAWI